MTMETLSRNWGWLLALGILMIILGVFAIAAPYGATLAVQFALGWILVSQVFPTILVIIPLFIILKQLGLLDALPGLTVVYVVFTEGHTASDGDAPHSASASARADAAQ